MAGAAGRSRDEVAAYLALAQVPGIGAARLRTLVAAFETAAAASRAPHGALAALPGFSRAAATAIRASSPGDTALLARPSAGIVGSRDQDRKSTRLNSSHSQ